MRMKILQYIALVLVVLVVIGAAQAQTDNSQPPADTTQQPAEAGRQGSNPPAGAFGQEPPAQTVTQFPPLSGLDEASLEPNYAARSFLIPGLQVTELADTNAGNQFRTGANSFTGDTHLLGSLALQRIWRR